MAKRAILFLVSGTSWNVPADFNPNDNLIECLGSSGNGSGRISSTRGGSGGGGGAYALKSNVNLTPGSIVNIQIGTPGGANDTFIQDNSSTTVVLAKRGITGTTTVAGTGGLASACIPTTGAFSGGNGFLPTTNSSGSGGGGGSAGPNGAGSNSVGNAGGAADNGTVTGGAALTIGNSGTEWDATHGSGSGAGGRTAASATGSGFTGGSFGGAGSGAGTQAANTGGAGTAGLIVIQYNPIIIPPIGPVTFGGQIPVITDVRTPTGSASFSGQQPTALKSGDAIKSPNNGTLLLSGITPIVSTFSPSLNLVVTPSRTSGVAPLLIHFDTTGTTTPVTSLPFEDIDYSWSFGDSSSGKWRPVDGTGIISVTSVTQTGGVATVTTPSLHKFITGDRVTISGATPDGYNQQFAIITALSGTSFTYPVSSALTTPATGTITLRGEIGNSRNSSKGPMGAHVFETPGLYTVTCTAYDGTNTVVKTISITVNDPVTIYSGSNTICFSNTTDFTGAPLGAQLLSNVNNFTTALSGNLATGKRLLFRRGDTFNTATAAIVNVNGPVTIGAFGTGPRPVINNTTGDLSIQLSSSTTPTISDIRIMDLDVNSNGNLNASGIGIGGFGGGMDQFLVLRCTMRNGHEGFELSESILAVWNTGGHPGHHIWDVVGFVDCDVPSINGSTAGYAVFVSVKRLAMMGSFVSSNSGGEHVFRMPFITKSVIDSNVFSLQGAGGKHVMKMHGPSRATTSGDPTIPNTLHGADEYTESNVVSRNQFVAGTLAETPWTVAIAPQDTQNDERLRNILVEGNFFKPGPFQQEAIHISAANVTVRNNIFNVTGTAFACAAAVEHQGLEPQPSGIKCYNNTVFTSSTTGANTLEAFAFSNGTGHFARNNLVYAPNVTNPIVVSGSATSSNNSSNPNTSPSFFGSDYNLTVSLSKTSDYRILTTSYAKNAGFNVPAYSDFTGQARPVSSYDIGAFEWREVFPLLNVSRTSGVAPLYVHFDATETTTTVTNIPFHEVEYTWVFGDPSSGNWRQTDRSTDLVISNLTQTNGVASATCTTPHGLKAGNRVTIRGASPDDYNQSQVTVSISSTTVFTYSVLSSLAASATGTMTATIETGNSRNYAKGPVAGHVFETPGTYTVTCSAYDGVKTGTQTVTIIVDDPAVVYSGNNTIAVRQSATGDFTGAPSTASQQTVATWSAVVALLTQGKKVLLRRGDIWTTAPSVTTTASSWSLGAFNQSSTIVGPLPLIRATAGGGAILSFSNSSNTVADCRITDVDFDQALIANTAANVTFAGKANTITFLRTRLRNGGNMLDFPRDVLVLGDPVFTQFAIVDCTFTKGTGAAGPYGYCQESFISGNVCHDSGSHVSRFQYSRKNIFNNNLFSLQGNGSASGVHLLKIHAPNFGGDPDPNGGPTVVGANGFSELSTVSDNVLVGGTAPGSSWSLSIEPQNNTANERIRNFLIERNYVNYSGTNTGISVSGNSITIRNNILDSTGAAADVSAKGSITVSNRGTEPVPTNVWIYNNSSWNPNADPGTNYAAIQLGDPAASTLKADNVVIKNNLAYAPNAVTPSMVRLINAPTNVTQGVNTTNVKTQIPNWANGTPPSKILDFRILTTSYAKNFGTVVPVFSDGSLRNRPATFSLGAMEWRDTYPSFLPTRVSGVAPLYVFFDATKTTSESTSVPFHELQYDWDFGDSNAGSWNDIYDLLTITSLTQTAGVATAITSSPHKLFTGDTITVRGATPYGYNQLSVAVTVLNSTFFSYLVASSLTSPATGTITAFVKRGNSKNKATGAVAGHVFESPGVFTVTSTTIGPALILETYQTQINVIDPDVVYAGANTICFSNTTDFTGAPSSSTKLTTSDFNAAVNNNLNTNKRLLFKRGNTFNSATQSNVITNGPATIGAFGTGPLPLINRTGGPCALVLSSQSTPGISDYRIMDLEINGGDDTQYLGIGIRGDANFGGGINQVLLARCSVHNSHAGFMFDESRLEDRNVQGFAGHTMFEEIAIVDCMVTRISGAAGGMSCYYSARHFFLAGTYLDNGGQGEHTLRSPYTLRAAMTNNYLEHSNAAKHVLKLHAPSSQSTSGDQNVPGTIHDINDQYTEMIVISDNKFNTNLGDWTISFSPQDTQNNEKVRNVVLERNWHTADSGSTQAIAFHNAATYITLRNNIFDISNSTGDMIGINITQRGLEPISDNIRVYNNTFFRSTSNNFGAVTFGAAATNVTVRNNLGYAPTSTTPRSMVFTAVNDPSNSVNPGAGFASSNNSTDAQILLSPSFISGNTPVKPIDYRLKPGSYALEAGASLLTSPSVPVMDDFYNKFRPLGIVTDKNDLGAIEGAFVDTTILPTGTLQFTGQFPSITGGLPSITPSTGPIISSGQQPVLLISGNSVVSVSTGLIITTGNLPTYTLAASEATGIFNLTGQLETLALAISVPVKTVSLGGNQPVVIVPGIVFPNPGTYLFNSLSPTIVSTEDVKIVDSTFIPSGAVIHTTRQLTVPAGKTTVDDFDFGLISDDTNPLPLLNLSSDDFTEIEYNLRFFLSAVGPYEFRITQVGQPLTAYTVTPTITISEGNEIPVGILTLSGNLPTLQITNSNLILINTGSLVVTGNSAAQSLVLSVQTGSVIVTGQAPLDIDSVPLGIVSIAGKIETLNTGYGINSTNLSVAGTTPALVTTFIIAIPTGAVIVSSIAPVLSNVFVLNSGIIAITGKSPSINETILVNNGSTSISGNAPVVIFTDNRFADIASGQLTLKGRDPAVSTDTALVIGVNDGEVLLIGQTPTIDATTGHTLPIINGSVSLTGNGPNVSFSYQVNVGTVSIVSVAEVLNTGMSIPTGNASLQGQTPVISVTQNVVIDVPRTSLTIARTTPIATVFYVVNVPFVAMSAIGEEPAASLSSSIVIPVNKAVMSVTGVTPSLARSVGEKLGIFVFSGLAPSLNRASDSDVAFSVTQGTSVFSSIGPKVKFKTLLKPKPGTSVTLTTQSQDIIVKSKGESVALKPTNNSAIIKPKN